MRIELLMTYNAFSETYDNYYYCHACKLAHNGSK